MSKIGKNTHCTRTVLLLRPKCSGSGSWLQATIRVSLKPYWPLSPAALLPLLVSCHATAMLTFDDDFMLCLLFTRLLIHLHACLLILLLACLRACALRLLVVVVCPAVSEPCNYSHVLWVQVALLAWLASMAAAICLSCASYPTKLTAGNQNNNSSESLDYRWTLLYASPDVCLPRR